MGQLQYIEGATAKLRYRPTDGIPSAASVEILHPTTGTLGAAVSADLPTAVATVSTDTPAREAPTVGYPVDSTAGLSVGQRVLAISDLGEVRDVALGGLEADRVYLRERLPFAMASGSQFADSVVSHDAAGLAAARGYRAVWTITVNGAQRVHVMPFDVVLQPFEVHLTKLDLVARWPPAEDRLEDGWQEGLSIVRDEIFDDLMASGLEPDQVWSTTALTSVAAWWMCHSLSLKPTPGGERRDEKVTQHLWGMYKRALTRVKSTHIKRDLDDDGVLGEDDPQNSTSDGWARGII